MTFFDHYFGHDINFFNLGKDKFYAMQYYNEEILTSEMATCMCVCVCVCVCVACMYVCIYACMYIIYIYIYIYKGET